MQASRREWPSPAAAAGQGPGGWRGGLSSCQDACPLHGAVTFRGTRVDGTPLTHSLAHFAMKQGCWEALSCKPMRGHLHLKFSASPLHPPRPGELTQVYPATLLGN